MACRRHHPSRDGPAKGLLYCVDTQAVTKDDIEEQVQARLRELMEPKAKKVNETAATLPDVFRRLEARRAAEKAEKPAGASSSSSDSSSSSSSGKKQKKKGGKACKSKKDKKAERKDI